MITLVFTATGFIPPDYSDDIGEENVVDLYINFGFYKDSFGRIYHEIVYETDGLRDFTLVNMDLQVDCCINTHFYIKAERLIKPSVYLNWKKKLKRNYQQIKHQKKNFRINSKKNQKYFTLISISNL